MGVLKDEIHEDLVCVTFDRTRDFFSHVTPRTTPYQFSEIIFEVCDDKDLSRAQKFSVLSHRLNEFAEYMTLGAVRKYFTMFPEDTTLLRTFYRQFRLLPTTKRNERRILLYRSPEVRIVEILLRAIKIVSPEDRKDFAGLALKKFPNLPGRDGHGNNIYRYTQEIAGFKESKRTKKPLPIPIPKPLPQPVASKEKTELLDTVQKTDLKSEGSVSAIPVIVNRERTVAQVRKRDPKLHPPDDPYQLKGGIKPSDWAGLVYFKHELVNRGVS